LVGLSKEAGTLQQATRIPPAVLVDSLEPGRPSAAAAIPEAEIELHPVVMAEVREAASPP